MNIKEIIKNFALLLASVILSYIIAEYFYNQIYSLIYGKSTGGGLFYVYEEAAKSIAVMVLNFIFFTSLNFTAFGGPKKYWWIGILLIPAIIFEVYFGLETIYIPITIGLIGWVIGFLVSKVLMKMKKAQ